MGKIHDEYLMVKDDKTAKAKFLSQLDISQIDEIDTDHGTLLYMAIMEDDLDTAISLMRMGADINIVAKHGFTPATLSLGLGYRARDVLIEMSKNKKFNIDMKDAQGFTALMQKVKIGSFDSAKLLLQLGADLTVRDNLGRNILYHAVNTLDYLEQKNLFRLLFKSGGGFKADFTGIHFPNDWTVNCLIIGSTKDGFPITRDTPGFQYAITNLQELKMLRNSELSDRELTENPDVAKGHAQSDEDYLENVCEQAFDMVTYEQRQSKKYPEVNISFQSRIFARYLTDPEVYKVYNYLIHGGYSLKSKLLFFVNDHPSKDLIEKLPSALKEFVEIPISSPTPKGNST